MPEERVRADLELLIHRVDTMQARRTRFRWSRPRLPRWKRVAAVPIRTWPTVIKTVGLAGLVELGMASLSIGRLASLAGMRLVWDGPRRNAPESVTPAAALSPTENRRVWATDRVFAAWPFGDTCLRRALVLGFHLRRDRPILRIGVAPLPEEDGRIASGETVGAHAWVETPRVTLLALPGYESLTSSTRIAASHAQ